MFNNTSRLCSDCEKQGICTGLCPEAILIANQDEVPQRELTIGVPQYGEDWPEPKITLTPKQAEIIALKLQGYSRAKIVERLHISVETYREYMKRIREKIRRMEEE